MRLKSYARTCAAKPHRTSWIITACFAGQMLCIVYICYLIFNVVHLAPLRYKAVSMETSYKIRTDGNDIWEERVKTLPLPRDKITFKQGGVSLSQEPRRNATGGNNDNQFRNIESSFSVDVEVPTKHSANSKLSYSKTVSLSENYVERNDSRIQNAVQRATAAMSTKTYKIKQEHSVTKTIITNESKHSSSDHRLAYSNSSDLKVSGKAKPKSFQKFLLTENKPLRCKEAKPKKLPGCVGCFRPNAQKLAVELREVPPNANTAGVEKAEYFTPSPRLLTHLVKEYDLIPSVCDKECPFLLAVQLSVLGNWEERDMVRKTWGSVSRTQQWPHRVINANVKVIFVLAYKDFKNAENNSGITNSYSSVQEMQKSRASELNLIQAEADQHGDILFVRMRDSYWHLTQKTLSAFAWVSEKCRGTQYVLKIDADTFVNLPLLVDILIHAEYKMKFSVMGHAYINHTIVYRKGEWAVDKGIYPMEFFPPYVSGCGYVLSTSALQAVVRSAPYVTFLPVEDAFITGVLRRVTGFRLISHSYLFTYHKDTSWPSCGMVADRKALGTALSPLQARAVWGLFQGNRSCV